MVAVDFIDTPRSPSMHRRIDVSECPFIRGQLTIGVHKPVARQQQQLGFGEFRIDRCKGDGMKREVPGSIPWVLPLVRHYYYVGVIQMQPVGIASVPSRCWRRWTERITIYPFGNVDVVEFL